MPDITCNTNSRVGPAIPHPLTPEAKRSQTEELRVQLQMVLSGYHHAQRLTTCSPQCYPTIRSTNLSRSAHSSTHTTTYALDRPILMALFLLKVPRYIAASLLLATL